ncbi:MAG: SusC/RagA family TonB-linked outer membrane protein [Bacteroidota bacterium]
MQIQKTGITIFIFLMGMFMVHAQTGQVTGTVFDAATGETLPGASIVVEGTSSGGTTNMDGTYSITVPAGDIVLEASFVGYEPSITEVTVTAGETVEVDFQLYTDIQTLQEFIVIGYGVTEKEDATGSVSVIGEEEFNRGNITTPSELITGKISGVQVTSGGGAPGSGETIRIRGGSSLSASNDPLIVIDGVPVESTGISGMRSALSMVNPNDIEDFTVLKDASATAIYGSRASNGVIIITTKKGELGAKPSFTYSGTYSMGTNAKTLDVLGAGRFEEVVNEMFPDPISPTNPNGSKRDSTAISLLGNASTNWQDQIFQNALSHDHNLSATGSYGNLPYRIALGYSSQDGVLKTDNMSRTSLSVGLNPSLLDDDLKINLNLRGVNVTNQFADNGAIGAAVAFDPTQPVTTDSDDFGGYFAWINEESGLPKPVATSNPVALLELRDDNSTVNRFIGNVEFDYQLPFLSGLSANLNLGYDYSVSDGEINVPDYAAFSFVRGGQIRTYDQEKRNELIDFYLNYNTEIPALQSTINLMGGYSWQHFYDTGSAFDTNIPNSVGFQAGLSDSLRVFEDTDYETEYYLVSLFSRLEYNLMEKYILTLTLRNDGTSRFVGDNQFGLFPSAAFAWRIDQEDFLQNVNAISQMKLRLGYGVTGQQNIGQGNYPALSRYTLNRQGAFYTFGNDTIRTLRPEGYDENLKWEETTTFNIGLDFGFANDRFTGSIDLYQRETNDLINFIPVPVGSNLTNALLTNIGNLENRGIEVGLNSRILTTPDYVWALGLNGTYSETEITKLTQSEDPSYLGVSTGGISGGTGNNIQMHSVGKQPNSFFVFEQVYDQDGNPIEGLYVDRNGDGQITDEDRYHYKSPFADFVFGINSSFEYKDFGFSFNGRLSLGNYMYNNVSSMNGELSRLYRSEGPYLSNITTDAFDVNFNSARYISDYYVQDASFFKMDNMSVYYNFTNLFAGSNLQVSFTVQNAFVITEYEGIDPEIALGIDNNFYPRPRNFVLGVNLQL